MAERILAHTATIDGWMNSPGSCQVLSKVKSMRTQRRRAREIPAAPSAMHWKKPKMSYAQGIEGGHGNVVQELVRHARGGAGGCGALVSG